jgi:catechol 2,3-dioxygenase-like lactoylglutathione lyase family enzyme
MFRLQLALNVSSIDQAVAFYSRLLGAEPTKVRPGYANFAIAEPPYKLVLLENHGQGGILNHPGVEVSDTEPPKPSRRAWPRRARRGRGARYHLLLCQAGQVLGTGRTRQRTVGDLHRGGRPPDLLR